MSQPDRSNSKKSSYRMGSPTGVPSSTTPKNNVRRTLVLYPSEPPQFERALGTRRIGEQAASHHLSHKTEESGAMGLGRKPPAGGVSISDSATALAALRKQALMFNNSGGAGATSVYTSRIEDSSHTVPHPTPSVAANGQPPVPFQGSSSSSAQPAGTTMVARRQPRSVTYSLGRLSNHHYVSSMHASENPFVSITPQGPIAPCPLLSTSGRDVMLLGNESDGDEDEGEESPTTGAEGLQWDMEAPTRNGESPKDALQEMEQETTPPRPNASRGGRNLPFCGDAKPPVRLGGGAEEDPQRILQRVPGVHPPSEHRDGLPTHGPSSAPHPEGDRPTTAGFHAAYHAAPYDRVGNRRGLLELLKLRSDVASMRAKQKVAPIYRELRARGASMPAWLPSTPLKGGAMRDVHLTPSAVTTSEYASMVPSRPSSAGTSPSQWGGGGGAKGAADPLTKPPIMKVQPIFSNALPPQHQEAIRQQVDRRATSIPLHERSEGELQDELAKQSCDAVGLTPVLAGSTPKGRYVVLNLLTTWGDNHEVGLCGVEFFNERGDRLLPSASTTAGAVNVGLLAAVRSATNISGSPSLADEPLSPPPSSGTPKDSWMGRDGLSAASTAGVTPRMTPQEVSIEKDVVSLRCAAADGSLQLWVEHSATPEELGLWKTPTESPGSGHWGVTSSHSGAGAQQQQLSGAARGVGSHRGCEDAGTPLPSTAVQRIQMDPRRQIASVVDGVVNTHDESHMLIIPYSPGHHHLLCFVFAHPITLSMIRIYNYCGRGRVQTFKGVRIAEITMDDDVIFRGEIQRHSGEIISEDKEETSGLQNCENILFTEEEAVLSRIVASSQPYVGDAVVTAAAGRNTTPGRGPKGRVGGDLVEEDLTQDTSEPLFVTSRSAPPPSQPPGAATRIIVRSSKYDNEDDMGAEQPMTWRGSSGGRALGSPSDRYRPESVMSSTAPAGTILPSILHVGSEVFGGGDGAESGRTGSGGSNGGKARRYTNPTSTLAGARGSANTTPITQRSETSTTSQLPGANETPSSQTRDGSTSRSRQQSNKVVVFPARCPKNIRSVCFMFLATWGDPRTIGLSGLRFRSATGNLISQPVFAWRVQYPDGSHSDPEHIATFTEQVGYLFDENANTACTVPFCPAVQLVMVFEEAVPSLGFLEVANYSVCEKTFCGVKEVRLFLSEGHPDDQKLGNITLAQREIDRYRELWTYASSPESRAALQAGRVFEVTPPTGVSLRKAPAYLSVPRFQTYDLSLQGGTAEPQVDAWGDAVEGGAEVPAIGVGLGTGGATDDSGLLMGMRGAAVGGYFATSFASSLNASMNIRAAMAMKRARMMLRERPEWLLEYQPYVTPLLPVGYVCKVRLHICARDVGFRPHSGISSSERDLGDAEKPLFKSAGESLKAFMREWVLKPFRSCSFVNESGEVLRPINKMNHPRGMDYPKDDVVTHGASSSRILPTPQTELSSHVTESQRDRSEDRDSVSFSINAPHTAEVVDESCCVPMVVESVISTLPVKTDTPYQDHVPLQVFVDLIYVADTPFCLAVLCLNKPLVLDGSAAWVKRVQVSMDDAVVFDSEEAIIALDPKHPPMSSSSTRSGGPASFPKCVSSLKPYVLFTLDSNLLDEVRRNIDA